MAVLAKIEFGILRLTIDRPQKRNAINAAMFDSLTEALVSAERNNDVRVVLLEGGETIFSAGADLEELLSSPDALTRASNAFFAELRTFPKPVVAQVNGPCVGEAFAALLYCDLVYASENALFSLPAVALARTPTCGSAAIMSEAAGHARTAEKLLLSEPISAQEAADMKLLTAIYDAEALPKAVAAKVARLAVLPPGAVQATKALLCSVRETKLAAFTDTEARISAEQAASAEAKEALSAFLAGRKPVFRHAE